MYRLAELRIIAVFCISLVLIVAPCTASAPAGDDELKDVRLKGFRQFHGFFDVLSLGAKKSLVFAADDVSESDRRLVSFVLKSNGKGKKAKELLRLGDSIVYRGDAVAVESMARDGAPGGVFGVMLIGHSGRSQGSLMAVDAIAFDGAGAPLGEAKRVAEVQAPAGSYPAEIYVGAAAGADGIGVACSFVVRDGGGAYGSEAYFAKTDFHGTPAGTPTSVQLQGKGADQQVRAFAPMYLNGYWLVPLGIANYGGEAAGPPGVIGNQLELLSLDDGDLGPPQGAKPHVIKKDTQQGVTFESAEFVPGTASGDSALLFFQQNYVYSTANRVIRNYEPMYYFQRVNVLGSCVGHDIEVRTPSAQHTIQRNEGEVLQQQTDRLSNLVRTPDGKLWAARVSSVGISSSPQKTEPDKTEMSISFLNFDPEQALVVIAKVLIEEIPAGRGRSPRALLAGRVLDLLLERGLISEQQVMNLMTMLSFAHGF